MQNKERKEARGHDCSLPAFQVNMQNGQSTPPIHTTGNIKAPAEIILEYAKTERGRRNTSAYKGFRVT
jgi:hypothetical protein